MTHIVVRDAQAEDFDTIVELNAAVVQQTSPMDLARLHELAQLASHHTVAEVEGRVVAFLLAMRERAQYQNDNYAWFAARFAQFLYVDRIVVGAEFAGLKIGRRLYQDMFDRARSQGVKAITCEYNIDPPNPASQRFHDSFGFRELGRQWVADGTKRVSLQVAEVTNTARADFESGVV
jgi:predicted GNAT superfamily acetyltransferase